MKLSFPSHKINSLIKEIEAHDVSVHVFPFGKVGSHLKGAYGMYFPDDLHLYFRSDSLIFDLIDSDIQKRSIAIDSSLPNYFMASALFHEFGHHLCCQNKCKCITSHYNPSMQEYHAMRNELHESLQRKFVSPLVHAMISICSYIHPRTKPHLRDACLKLIKLRVWQDSYDLVGGHLRKWMLENWDVAKYSVEKLSASYKIVA